VVIVDETYVELLIASVPRSNWKRSAMKMGEEEALRKAQVA
jgi:hypothetical protein